MVSDEKNELFISLLFADLHNSNEILKNITFDDSQEQSKLFYYKTKTKRDTLEHILQLANKYLR